VAHTRVQKFIISMAKYRTTGYVYTDTVPLKLTFFREFLTKQILIAVQVFYMKQGSFPMFFTI